VKGGEYALFGTTMSPGFEFTDFIAGETQELIQAYPDAKNDILRFSHKNKL
jgi:predicted cupin superfamily sugar epimerase